MPRLIIFLQFLFLFLDLFSLPKFSGAIYVGAWQLCQMPHICYPIVSVLLWHCWRSYGQENHPTVIWRLAIGALVCKFATNECALKIDRAIFIPQQSSILFIFSEVLGAILSIFGIWLLTTFLFYFAVNRVMYQDFDINADTMMIVSAIGIVINIM